VGLVDAKLTGNAHKRSIGTGLPDAKFGPYRFLDWPRRLPAQGPFLLTQRIAVNVAKLPELLSEAFRVVGPNT
jgi:hypothetical protein